MAYIKTELQPKDRLSASLVNAMQDAIIEAQNHELIVVGTYTGDGESEQVIDLGVPIAAVLVTNGNGLINQYDSGRGFHSIFGGLALSGYTASTAVTVVDNGFKVRTYNGTTYTDITSNAKGNIYHFVAVIRTGGVQVL